VLERTVELAPPVVIDTEEVENPTPTALYAAPFKEY